MRLSTKAALLAAAGALALLAGGPALAQADYEIRIFRPNKVGDRYRVAAEGRHLRQVVARSRGSPDRRSVEGLSVEFTGTVEVLEADERGNVLHASVRVESLVRVLGMRRDEVLRPGTLISERRSGGRPEFRINDRVVEGALKDLLDVVLVETNDPAAPNDDELLGTKERRKVGERWPVNRERLARFFSDDNQINLAVNPGDVEGEGALAALAQVDGVDCLRINVGFSISGQPRNAMVVGALTSRARVDVKLSGLYPVDPKLDPREESTQLVMTLATPASPIQADGKAADEVITIWEQRTDRKLQPVR